MFRKLYWVTEEVAGDGSSIVTGVYTSASDLVDLGMRWVKGNPGGFRITLVKLDGKEDVLGRWASPAFDNFESDMAQFVATGEYTIDDVSQIRQALANFTEA